MTSIELLVCLLLMGFSSFLSASELALFSLSRFQLRSMKERIRSGYKKIKKLVSDPAGLLITILVLNEIVNISLSSIVAKVVSRTHQANRDFFLFNYFVMPDWAWDTILGVLATTPLILVVCDMTPKVIGTRANQLISSLAAGPMSLLYNALKPIRVTLKRVIALASNWATGNKGPKSSDAEVLGEKLLKESDFMLMVEEGAKEGAIQQSELDLIRNVFDLDDISVAEVFTPLAQVRTLPAKTTLKTALLSIRGLQYSRIPVTSSDRKLVVGVLHAKDLLRARLDPAIMNLTVEALMRKPLIVPPTTPLNQLFRRLKQNKTHMAIVQEGDRLDRTLGIITMHDIVEALFEDLFSEGETDDEINGSLETPPPDKTNKTEGRKP